LGHKVHPTGFRLGIIKDWQSKWYSDTSYAEFVQEDNKLREEIKSKYREAAISLIEIDRQAKDITITLHTARPGIVIGRGGQRVDEMRLHLENLVGKRIRLNIQEVRQPELDAYLVARSVAEQMERRIAYRRAMRQAMFRTIQAGAKGIKISVAGRLGGAEIARRQTAHEGQVPLHTLRADIDYGFTEARTTMGRIGIKVWIYKGQILPEVKVVETEEKPEEETTEDTVAAEAQEKPAEAVAEEVTTTKPEEKPSEAVVEDTIPAEPQETPPKAMEEEVTATEPQEEPAEAVVEEVTTAEKKEKPSKAKTAAASSEVEKKPAKPRAKKTTATTATKTGGEEDKEKPAPKKRKKATTTADTTAKVEETLADADGTIEPGTEQEGESKDAAA
jgi:small subunit ribosomal protein S3